MPTLNGVDTDRVGEVIQAIGEKPELAQVTFTVESEWAGGFKARSRTGALHQAGAEDKSRTATFELGSDEPPALLGEDSAASAGEYALKALAACYAVTFAANAAAAGIELDSLRMKLEGDFDLHGFFGLDENVRPGMQELRVKVQASSPNASRQQLEELVKVVEQRSPIRDTLSSPVTVLTELA